MLACHIERVCVMYRVSIFSEIVARLFITQYFDARSELYNTTKTCGQKKEHVHWLRGTLTLTL